MLAPLASRTRNKINKNCTTRHRRCLLLPPRFGQGCLATCSLLLRKVPGRDMEDFGGGAAQGSIPSLPDARSQGAWRDEYLLDAGRLVVHGGTGTLSNLHKGSFKPNVWKLFSGFPLSSPARLAEKQLFSFGALLSGTSLALVWPGAGFAAAAVLSSSHGPTLNTTLSPIVPLSR